MDYKKTLKKLKKSNQEHLLMFYDKLNPKDQEKLLVVIEKIDISLINKLYNKLIVNASLNALKRKKANYNITPLRIFDSEDVTSDIVNLGDTSIKNNEVALITMVGGLGTRLGHNHPKGTFELDLKSGKISLFEIIINNLKKVNLEYGIKVPWYIMCSNNNIKETKEYFERKNYFDYPKSKIKFFVQNELPIVLENGKIALKNQSKIYTASNGNGDVFKAFNDAGLLNEATKSGIKWFFISGIDNVLNESIDSKFLGLTIANKLKIGSKSITKKKDLEKGYIFCKKSNKVYMLESSKITPQIDGFQTEGKYLYREKNIVSHLVHIDSFKKYVDFSFAYHDAYRAIDYINSKGELVKGIKPNSYKFEKYIYEAFYKDKDMLLYSIDDSLFSPLKNLEGNESVITATNDYEKHLNL